ncbi:MAG TPA: DUF885 family protein [Pyrinomonadaceae bacterium]|jgi:uncharacterized protein (DUF885 family)
MKRKLSVSLLAFVVVAACVLQPFEAAAQKRRPARRVRRPVAVSGQTLQNRFQSIADEYLRGYYEFNPTEATALGLHEYDSKLESRSRESVAAEVKRLHAALAELLRINPNILPPESRYDYLTLVSHARSQLLELEDIRMWQRNPNVYNHLAASCVDNILKRNYAPVEQRLDAVLAREREIARLLNEARLNLENPPRIYTETAIAQARGSLDYFTRVVPQMIERAGGGRLSAARRAQVEASNQSVIAALNSFAEWLARDLLPRSGGEFAIGEENFRRKLLYDEMVETPISQLIRDGERELRKTQEEMRVLAEEITPGRDVVYALQTLGRDHPTADGLVGDTRAELDRIRAFVRTQNILTPPARENLIVNETPEYARSTSFASMDAPGAFERVATEAYFYVTPPDADWDARRKDEHLSFYNRSSLPIIAIHEVYPGHYYQFLALKGQFSRVRTALGSASFVEGWAHYCEQMMLDEGFGGNNPKLRLAQLNLALLRLCRYLVGLRMHTAGMTYEQGVEFFMREGYQERVNAEREARRGTLDPTYLVYTLGKMEILKLRDEWRARLGASFRLGEFHDRLLSFGMPPLKVIRLAMLGESSDSDTAHDSSEGEDTRVVDFTVLATGAWSSYEGARYLELVSNQADWQRVWRTVGGGDRPMPEVNFNTRAVVVVYQGRKNTGGYSIAVEEIRRTGANLILKVKEQSPRPGEITTDALTSPFVVVSIPRPPGAPMLKFEDDVIKQAQNRNVNQITNRQRRRYRRGSRRF